MKFIKESINTRHNLCEESYSNRDYILTDTFTISGSDNWGTRKALTVAYRKSIGDFAIREVNPNAVYDDARLRFASKEEAEKFVKIYSADTSLTTLKISRAIGGPRRVTKINTPYSEDVDCYVSEIYIVRNLDESAFSIKNRLTQRADVNLEDRLLKESFPKRQEEFDKLFDKYVPGSGKAPTVAGELLRAVGRIGYRYFNDGDKIGTGYGRETVNAAARYVMKKGSPSMATTIEQLWSSDPYYEMINDQKYEILLNKLVNTTLQFIETNPELTEKPNNEDLWNYTDPEEDVDDYPEEDEEYYDEDDYYESLDIEDDEEEWEEVESKQVSDEDGFMTDYTLYKNKSGTYIAMLGDIELYEPDPDYADFVTTSKRVAYEMFNDFNGLEDIDD